MPAKSSSSNEAPRLSSMDEGEMVTCSERGPEVIRFPEPSAAAPSAMSEHASAEPPSDPNVVDQLKELLLESRLNLLLVCVPLAFFVHLSSFEYGGTSAVFILSFLSLVPLAKMLGDLTEDIALRTNDAIGALINVTFGNATELIISIAALRSGQYAIITNSLVGSILGNMLLVLGSSLIAAGWNNPMTRYNAHAAQIYMSTLMLTCFAFLIPTLFLALWGGEPDAERVDINGPTEQGQGQDSSDYFTTPAVLRLSRELSVVLIVIYGAYIYFQVKSHKRLFDGEGKIEDLFSPKPVIGGNKKSSDNGAAAEIVVCSASESATTNKAVEESNDDDDEEPKFSLLFGVVATGIVAVLISFLSDLLVETMTPAADSLKLGFHFTSLVVVPIVGNVAEHASAIVMAKKGKVDIAFGVALGSSIQIGMFAMPVMVLIAFAMGKPFDLSLPPFIGGITFAAVIVTNTIVSAGSSTWLSGAKLLAAYVVLAVSFIEMSDSVR